MQAIDVKFSQDLKHQKSQKSVIFTELFEKYKGGRFLWDTVYILATCMQNVNMVPRPQY